MKFKSNWQGMCPYCNGRDLDYNTIQFADDMCYFPWECCVCGKTGEEWYSMQFVGHNVNTEDGNIEITDNMVGVE